MNTKNDSQKKILARALRHYSQITSRVLATTVGTIAILGIPAYFIDQWLETFPIIFGIALVVSLPISQVATIRVMQKYLKDNPQD